MYDGLHNRLEFSNIQTELNFLRNFSEFYLSLIENLTFMPLSNNLALSVENKFGVTDVCYPLGIHLEIKKFIFFLTYCFLGVIS